MSPDDELIQELESLPASQLPEAPRPVGAGQSAPSGGNQADAAQAAPTHMGRMAGNDGPDPAALMDFLAETLVLE